ncbi:MAG: amidohydrolase family protein [Candidatus Aureabacteria bacterium]|nr:amidohydrolase family protein [Candidatus Auribacterota bacterium]
MIKIENGSVVLKDRIEKTDLYLLDDKISFESLNKSPDKTINAEGKYIFPGFVDIHFHGCNLFDFTLGKYNPETRSFDDSEEAFSEGIPMLAQEKAGQGVTSLFLGTFAAPIKNLQRSFGYLKKFIDNKSNGLNGSFIHGGLLEGTFISPDFLGAQSPTYVFKPDIKIFNQINKSGAIKLANIVSEYGEDSIKLTKYLTKNNIAVGAGHTKATCFQIEEAMKAGLKYFIHFMNGPTNTSYKPFNGGGAAEAVLKNDEIYAELILDGYHVSPAYIRDAINRKTNTRIVAVTDSMFLTGSNKIKEFEIFGVKGTVSSNRDYLAVEKKENTLFGSVLTTDKAFSNLLSWLTQEIKGIWIRKHCALDFDEALVSMAKIFATNSCNMLGLKSTGVIEQDKSADLTIGSISEEQGGYNFKVEHTIVNGRLVFSTD